MADLCCKGSIIAQDIYSKPFIDGETSFAVKKQSNIMAKMGEPWKFGLDMSDKPREVVEAFLNECGLELSVYKQFGVKLGLEPYYCIVESHL